MIKSNTLDHPNQRSSHSQPIPRGGGISCLLGLLAGTWVGLLSGWPTPASLLAAAVVLAFVGYLDDRVGLSAEIRLVSQLSVGAIYGIAFGQVWTGVLSAAVFALFVNAVNFMDGINGITSIVVLVWGVSYGLLALHDPATRNLTVIGLTAAAASAGFLIFNIAGAIFLGDVGSYLFGALVAAALMFGGVQGLPLWPMIAPVSLYILDVIYTLWRRFRAKKAFGEAHREHVYQRLTHEAQLPHLAVAAAVGGLSAALSVLSKLESPTLIICISILLGAVYLASPRLIASWRGLHVEPKGEVSR